MQLCIDISLHADFPIDFHTFTRVRHDNVTYFEHSHELAMTMSHILNIWSTIYHWRVGFVWTFHRRIRYSWCFKQSDTLEIRQCMCVWFGLGGTSSKRSWGEGEEGEGKGEEMKCALFVNMAVVHVPFARGVSFLFHSLPLPRNMQCVRCFMLCNHRSSWNGTCVLQ